jgi:hypothetical protein
MHCMMARCCGSCRRTWRDAVILRAAIALGVGTFIGSVGGASLGAPWTEILMETVCAVPFTMQSCPFPLAERGLSSQACDRANITFPSVECNQASVAQSESAWRQEWINLATTVPNFLTVFLPWP